MTALAVGGACVPSGSSKSTVDAGPAESPSSTPIRPSFNVMKEPFEDTFDRPAKGTTPQASATASAAIAPSVTVNADAAAKALLRGHAADAARQGDAAQAASQQPPSSSASASAPSPPENDLGPDWSQAQTNVWRIENGKLCGQGARNHGVWLNRTLPVNARIEFDAQSFAPEGDLKAEVWGDGRSYATGTSYTNATSYLVIFGGWNNSIHAIARINEHGRDRKEIAVDPKSDDPRQRPVGPGQLYHFKIERTDGKTVKWYVDDQEMRTFVDPSPLAGMGHDHFGFNDWNAKVCFDNVKVTPLP
jgi:hypothetical protein